MCSWDLHARALYVVPCPVERRKPILLTGHHGTGLHLLLCLAPFILPKCRLGPRGKRSQGMESSGETVTQQQADSTSHGAAAEPSPA